MLPAKKQKLYRHPICANHLNSTIEVLHRVPRIPKSPPVYVRRSPTIPIYDLPRAFAANVRMGKLCTGRPRQEKVCKKQAPALHAYAITRFTSSSSSRENRSSLDELSLRDEGRSISGARGCSPPGIGVGSSRSAVFPANLPIGPLRLRGGRNSVGDLFVAGRRRERCKSDGRAPRSYK